MPDDEYPTELARDICERLIPEWRDLFLVKNAGYGEAHALLGARGCFPDVYRKVHKLKRALWDGETLTGEQPREILQDMIGHCFMLISQMDADEHRNGRCAHCERLVPVEEGQLINGSLIHDDCAIAFLTKELQS